MSYQPVMRDEEYEMIHRGPVHVKGDGGPDFQPGPPSDWNEDEVPPDLDQKNGATHTSDRPETWTPGCWQNFPVLAVLALLGVFAGTIAVIIVLVSSDKQPVEDWGNGVSPSVYMAMASAVCNVLLSYALVDGLVILFWTKSLQGHTLSELNRSWLCGQSLRHAVFQGHRAGGRVASIACILSALAFLRGPLNQRASSVHTNVEHATSGQMTLSVARYLPSDYAGIRIVSRNESRETARLTHEFANVMQQYSQRSDISLDTGDDSCGNSCTMTVKFHAISRLGPSNQVVFNISSELYEAVTNPEDMKQPPTTMVLWDNVGVRFNATYSVALEPGDREGGDEHIYFYRMRSHICDLSGSVVEYQVRMTLGIATLSGDRVKDKVIESVNLTDPFTLQEAIVGGFVYAAANLFESSVIWTTSYNNSLASGYSFTGALANEMVRFNTTPGNGETVITDPMDQMLDTMREIAFRTAVYAGKDETIRNITKAEQSFEYLGTQLRSIYVTNWPFGTSAAVVSVLSLVAVAATFWGWSELGKGFSMSPLEIAMAFDAPLLSKPGVSRGSDGEKCEECVRYGERVVGDVGQATGSRLVFDVATEIQRPRKNVAYGI